MHPESTLQSTQCQLVCVRHSIQCLFKKQKLKVNLLPCSGTGTGGGGAEREIQDEDPELVELMCSWETKLNG